METRLRTPPSGGGCRAPAGAKGKGAADGRPAGDGRAGVRGRDRRRCRRSTASSTRWSPRGEVRGRPGGGGRGPDAGGRWRAPPEVDARRGDRRPGRAASAAGSLARARPCRAGRPGRRTPRRLTDLSDAELLERIERLDRALDRARAAMIRRLGEVEQELAAIAPERAKEREPDVPVLPGPRPQPKPKPKPRPTRPSTMSRDQVTALQRALNAFTEKHLKAIGPLMTDGIVGPATKKRIREAKFYLGYTGAELQDGPRRRRVHAPPAAPGVGAVLEPGDARPGAVPPAQAAQGRQGAAGTAGRRGDVRRQAGRRLDEAVSGGARNNGWQGTLNSGWRSPAYWSNCAATSAARPAARGGAPGARRTTPATSGRRARSTSATTRGSAS